MATRRSFGGTMTAQVSFGTLVVLSSFSIWRAWKAIRVGKVESHRAWMLRAWCYICSVSIAPSYVASYRSAQTNANRS